MTHKHKYEIFYFILLCYMQVHPRAAGGAGKQRVSDRREHAVPWDEGETGERTAGYEAVPVSL